MNLKKIGIKKFEKIKFILNFVFLQKIYFFSKFKVLYQIFFNLFKINIFSPKKKTATIK